MKFNKEAFWDNYRTTYGKVTQKTVDAIEELLHGFETFKEWKDLQQIAYAFGTIKHETAGTFEPITEYGNRAYFDKYEGRKTLGNNKKGDGYKFRGRGFVQITGRANYEKFSDLLGIDLTVNPELALLTSNALYILTVGMHKGLFTGKKLSDYINLQICDYKNARRIINGTDKAILIAGYAREFEEILLASKVSPKIPSQETAIDDNDTPALPPPETTREEFSAEVKAETKTEVSVTDGNVKVSTSDVVPKPKEQVAIVKEENLNFGEKIWKKITALFGGNVGLDVVSEKAQQAQTFGLPSSFWLKLTYFAVAASIIYLALELYRHWSEKKQQAEKTKTLVEQNSTADNFVQLIDAEKVEDYKSRGYKIITR